MGNWDFHPSQLGADRPPGISAFMRIRNGEDFLRASIESHLPFFDEIVAVYNACTDSTPRILEALAGRYPDRVRVFHYLPRVFPVGSQDHIRTRPDSVHSIAHYYNYSLARTRYSVALKLDDDHLAIPEELGPVVRRIRAEGCRLPGQMLCFSGLNLCQVEGRVGIVGHTPFAGNGDHFFFEVNPRHYFTKDRRFEVFIRRGLRRTYVGLLYWHCKYLKADHGFSNYELALNPNSRYHKQWRRFLSRQSIVSPADLQRKCRERYSRHRLWAPLWSRLNDKFGLAHARDQGFDGQAAAERLHRLLETGLTRGEGADPIG